MNFFEKYKSILEVKKRSALRNKIVRACKIEVFTFYGWIRRKKVPPLAQEKISEIMDVPQSELFPTETEK